MSIRDRTLRIIAAQLGVELELLKDETTFENDLGADSLDEVELLMELEEEFDITIGDEECEGAATIGQAITLLEKKLAPVQSPTLLE